MIRTSTLRRVLPVAILMFGAAGLLALAGCSKPTLFANPDPSLDRTKDQFRQDASRRYYPVDAPRSYEPKARAQVGYAIKRLEVVNFTGKDWANVEVWINGRYVCYVPRMEDRKLKEINFGMLYDQNGRILEIDKAQPIVDKVEIYRDGVMYAVTCHNADW